MRLEKTHSQEERLSSSLSIGAMFCDPPDRFICDHAIGELALWEIRMIFDNGPHLETSLLWN